MRRKSKIIIVGYKNLISVTLFDRLRKNGFKNLIFCDSAKIKSADAARAYSSLFEKEKPDYCFLTTLSEGGILANITYPAELLYNNLAAQTNIIHNAYRVGVKKLIFFASSCVYPRDCSGSLKEDYLLSGSLEHTSEPYAIAKIAGIKMCQSYNNQYGTNFVSVIPATIFGPHDNFDLRTSHVIPALIRRFHEAKEGRKKMVKVWGSAKVRREFIFVQDAVGAAIFLMQRRVPFDIVNIGNGTDVSLHGLPRLIKNIVGFQGKILFDTNKPSGVRRKLLDISRMISLGWKAKFNLETGIEITYQWYKQRCVS